jgi:integrase
MRKTTTRINFTKKALEALPVPPQRRAVYRDSQTRGLGVMLQPTGHRAFFWFRKIRGRPTWKTIGLFPDLSIDQARARAAELNAALASWKARDYCGDDPIIRRRHVTLGFVLNDYVEKRLSVHAKDPIRAISYIRWQFNTYLASWRDRKLGEIRRVDVRDLHAKIGESHGKITANRLIQCLRTFFNWALKSELWSGENPARGISLYPESSRTRFVQPDELPKLFKALSEENNLDLRDFVLLALFTGARRSNVFAMRWEQLDLKRGLWSIPHPKNRMPYIVPLTDEALEILKQRRVFGSPEWVFPSGGQAGHIGDVKRSWRQLLKRAQINSLRIHDLRRTLGSWQAGVGVSLPIIGKTLGHQSSDATEIYARLHLEPVRNAIRTATAAMLSAGKVSKRKLLRIHHRA